MNKKIVLFLASIVLVFLLSISAFAHPGRTDSQGGHRNRSDGSYHFHHGYDEHQHPNGICPYDFDDKTNSSSSNNNSSSNTNKPSLSQKNNVSFSQESSSAADSKTPNKKKLSFGDITTYIVLGFSALIMVGCWVIYPLYMLLISPLVEKIKDWHTKN